MNTLRKIIAKCKRVQRVEGFGECWEWEGGGTKVRGGYGKVGFKGHAVLVHRLMYAMFVGDLDACEVVMHMCDNCRCCNPSHLTGGTHRDNAMDASIKSRLRGKLGSDQAKQMRDMFAAGASRTDLRKHFGVCSAVVTETLCGKLHTLSGGDTVEAIVMLGESHSHAKMTEETVRQIRALRQDGATYVALAKQFGLHHSTVMDIVKRKTWRQVS